MFELNLGYVSSFLTKHGATAWSYFLVGSAIISTRDQYANTAEALSGELTTTIDYCFDEDKETAT